MLDALAQLGVTTQCVTPHQKANQYLPTWEAVTAAYQTVSNARRDHHPTLHLAAENMWDNVFHERISSEQIPAYQNCRSFLFELPPPALPTNVAATLFRLRIAGWTPVLAHPERYHALWANESLVRELLGTCAFVLDLPALAGYHGKSEMKFARRLAERGWFHAVATDAHTTVDVSRAAEGLNWLRKHTNEAVVERAFKLNPMAILASELPDPLSSI